MVVYCQCKGCRAIGIRKSLPLTPCTRCGGPMVKIPADIYDALLHGKPETPLEDEKQFNKEFVELRRGKRV